MKEKDEEIEDLNSQIETPENTAVHEDLDMYKEEVKRLKDYLHVLTKENEELKN